MATYPSKRAWWLLAIFWISLGLMIVGFVRSFTEPVAPWMRVFAPVCFVLLGALNACLLVLPYRTSYSLDAEALTIRMGSSSHAIPLSDIVEVFPTHNPLSAPAWSLDRLRVRLTSGRFGALISPEHKERFLDELEALAPHLVRINNRLARRDRQV